MGSINRPLRPLNARIERGGRVTRFSVMDKMFVHGELVDTGFVQILADGEYHFKEGDVLIVRHIKGWQHTVSSTKRHYFIIRADKLDYYTKEEYARLNDSVLMQMSDDIPEDLL